MRDDKWKRASLINMMGVSRPSKTRRDREALERSAESTVANRHPSRSGLGHLFKAKPGTRVGDPGPAT